MPRGKSGGTRVCAPHESYMGDWERSRVVCGRSWEDSFRGLCWCSRAWGPSTALSFAAPTTTSLRMTRGRKDFLFNSCLQPS
jgi:hypothetical protein